MFANGSDRTQDVQQLPGYRLCCVEVNNTVSLLVATTDMTSGDRPLLLRPPDLLFFSSNGAKGCPCAAQG